MVYPCRLPHQSEEKAMTPKKHDKQSGAERQATIQELLQERMRLAIRQTLIAVLEEEVENFNHAALYQRHPSDRVIASDIMYATW